MLILQRRAGESIRIGDNIEITVVATEGGRVRLAISAPNDVSILRSELIVAKETNKDAAMDQITPDQVLQMLDGLIPSAIQAQPAAAMKPKSRKTTAKSED